MASIITNKFRLENLRAFKAAMADTVNNAFYLFIGRITAWPNESVPPTPVDSEEMIRDTHSELLSGKKVVDTNVRQGVYLRKWTTGEFYDMYRHDYDGVVTGVDLTGAATTPDSLFEANYFVVDAATLNVYKCLYNRSATTNLPVASTVLPTTTAIAPQTTADGYMWKYMFTVPAGDAADYNTPSFIPAPDTDINSVSAPAGALYSAVVTAGGSGYTTATVTVDGDGSGAVATATITSGAVTKVVFSSAGTGYTYCTLTITGDGTNATAKAIIGPEGGHATSPADELGGIYLIVARKLIGSEGGDFTVANSPRQLGLIKNPTLAAALVTSGTVQFCRQVTLTGVTGIFEANEIVDGGTSNAKVQVVDWNAGTGVLRYVLVLNAGNDRLNFSAAETVTGANSGATATVGTVGSAEADEYTGSIIYFENRRAIARDAAQTEDYRLIVEF